MHTSPPYRLPRHLGYVAALAAFVAPVVAGLGTGCGSQGGDSPVLLTGGSGGSPGTSGSGGSVGTGGSSNEGTPCGTDGETRACGHVTHQQGIYLECAVGSQTCKGGKWGECVIDKFASAIAPPPPSGDSPLNLQVDAGACVNNPCDPACLAYSDTPTGLDAGVESGLVIDDAGVTLQGVVGSTGSACTGLTATPASVNVVVTDIPASVLFPITYTASPTTQYAAQFVPAGCFAGAVPALWTVDKPGISTISATGLFNLVGPVPGVINVKAYSGSWSTAPLPVNVTVNAVDVTNAPAGYTNASFTAGSVADSITVLYPYDNTVLPLGQLAPIIQWSAAKAAKAVRVQLRYPAGTGALFTWSGILPESQTAPTTPLLPAQPRAFIPQTVWTAFEQAAKGGTADFVIQRIVGLTVRKPNAPVNLKFATDQLKGTVYYQSYGTNLATNYPGALVTGPGPTKSFGAATLAIQAGATAPILIAGDNTNCRVCHSVASSGKALITQSNANSDRDSWYYDLGTLAQTDMDPTSSLADGKYAFAALSPDGTYLFSNSGPLSGAYSNNPSSLFTAPGGAAIVATGLPVGGLYARTPSFSPNAAHIAFQNYGLVQKSLGSIDFNPATKAFSNLQVLATPGVALGGGPTVGAGTIYSPTYLPNSSSLVWHLETVFNGRDEGGTRSQCDGIACSNNNDGTHAELWWTDVATKKSARLDKLNGVGLPTHAAAVNPSGDNQLNYEPTALPQTSGGYAWVVFTSRRLYGNIATINPFWSDPRFQTIDREPTTKKLWVAAIDLNPTPGTDPSHPAFYLQGQELLAGNARGYWVLDQCKAGGPPIPANLCTSDLDCCAGVQCILDAAPATTSHCSSAGVGPCTALGGACTADNQCCGFPANLCAQGTCQVPVPPVGYFPASFPQDYDGSQCPVGTHVVWMDAGLKAMLPTHGGTYSSIHIDAQTGADVATLMPVAPISIGTLSGPPVDQSAAWTNFDLYTPLTAAGAYPTNMVLRLTFTLNPTTDHKVGPVLLEWRARFDCAPTE